MEIDRDWEKGERWRERWRERERERERREEESRSELEIYLYPLFRSVFFPLSTLFLFCWGAFFSLSSARSRPTSTLICMTKGAA